VVLKNHPTDAQASPNLSAGGGRTFDPPPRGSASDETNDSISWHFVLGEPVLRYRFEMTAGGSTRARSAVRGYRLRAAAAEESEQGEIRRQLWLTGNFAVATFQTPQLRVCSSRTPCSHV